MYNCEAKWAPGEEEKGIRCRKTEWQKRKRQRGGGEKKRSQQQFALPNIETAMPLPVERAPHIILDKTIKNYMNRRVGNAKTGYQSVCKYQMIASLKSQPWFNSSSLPGGLLPAHSSLSIIQSNYLPQKSSPPPQRKTKSADQKRTVSPEYQSSQQAAMESRSSKTLCR